MLVRPLPPGCRLTSIFDVSCHPIASLSSHVFLVLPFWLGPRYGACIPHPIANFGVHPDLPYIVCIPPRVLVRVTSHPLSQYSTEGKIKEPNMAAEAGMGVLSAVSAYAQHDMGGLMRGVSSLFKTVSGGSQKATQRARAVKTSPADCVRE